MNTSAILKAPDRADDERSLPRSGGPGGQRPRDLDSPGGIGLWVFIGVATSLFSLFIAAYVMRMENNDWASIQLPWQLWLGTALLVAGSACMQGAASSAALMRALALAGGWCALGFIGMQVWGWRDLLAMRVMPTGNPAASFFYLLTAMHGLHVLGGLAAWGWAMHRMERAGREAARESARRIRLCARYWHFLLAAWIALYATFAGLTPEIVAYICGR
ncbi:MAG TPA: bb3-type cytochrome oxidase subunit III [Paucimonas sp.]|nr:bb3-type cytochrome oxidase subunit III [Paucimonas sp.]